MAVAQQGREAAGDPVLDAVRRAADPALLTAGLRRAWRDWSPASAGVAEGRLLSVHYKPFARARLLAAVRLEGDRHPDASAAPYLHLQIYPAPAAARRRRRDCLKKPVLPSPGPPVSLIEEWNAVAFTLPNGPRLRRLARFLDPAHCAAFLRKKGLASQAARVSADRMDLVRYVPRKRALLRLRQDAGGQPGLYLKLYTADDYARAARNYRRMTAAARAADLGFAVPRLAAKSRRRRTLVTEELLGLPLTLLLDAPSEAALERVGGALAGLHGSAVPASRPWSPAGELEAVRRGMDDVRRALPRLAAPLDRLLQDLERRLAGVAGFRAAPIHGNLFGDQILVDDLRVGILDWDDLALGDPCYDLGRLIAHMLYEARRRGAAAAVTGRQVSALRRGHRQGTAAPLPDPGLRWHVAAALLLRAKISGLRTLQPGWPELVEAAAEKARRVLNDGLESAVAAG